MWIGLWSPVRSANLFTSSCVIVRQLEVPSSVPTRSWMPAIVVCTSAVGASTVTIFSLDCWWARAHSVFGCLRTRWRAWRSSVDPHDDCTRGISGCASAEQADAATAEPKRLDEFGDGANAGGPLRMPPDER